MYKSTSTMYQRRGNFHRCEFHAVGFKRERGGGVGGGDTIKSRERVCPSASFRLQVQADVAADQAVAHAVGERLAEIIGVADVRRV